MANCQACDTPLEVLRFRHHDLFVCNKPGCRLFRERQGIVARGFRLDSEPDTPLQKPKRTPKHTQKTESYLALKRINYEALRALGYGCKEARDNCTKKKARAILGI